jgi:hypothetical protein
VLQVDGKKEEANAKRDERRCQKKEKQMLRFIELRKKDP